MSAWAGAPHLLGALRLEDGRLWGDVATPDQWEDARAILDPDCPTPYSFLTRARGYSKTMDLAGIALVSLLLLPPNSRAYALAADRDQGRLLVDAAEGFVLRGLHNLFRVDAWKITCPRKGSTLDVLAADAPGAWGLRPAFVVVDELAQWPTTPAARRLWDAVSTSVAKNPAAKMVVLTTAGDPAHWSHKVLEHAYSDPLWRVREVKGPPPWMDPARLEEQRRRLPESTFRRLFLNEWTASEDRLALPQDLAACATLDGPLPPEPGRSYVIGVDLGLKADRTVAAVCHPEQVDTDLDAGPRLRVVLDRMEVWAGTRDRPVRLSDVEGWLAQAIRAFRSPPIVLDPWQAIGLAQRLRGRGATVEEFTFSSASVGRLASALHVLIRDHALAIPNDPELIDELSNVRLRETSPGVLRMDHDPDKHDDRAIALALAAQRIVERDRVPVEVGWGMQDAAESLSRTPDPAYDTSDGDRFGMFDVERW